MAPDRLRRLVLQFGAFGVVGVVGLVVDILVLRGCLHLLGLGFYSSRVLSFFVAASTTWALNRRYTFRDADPAPLLRQWAAFVAANSVGGLVNYGVYAALIAFTEICRAWPELAIAAGSLSGMMLNFVASKRLIFKGA